MLNINNKSLTKMTKWELIEQRNQWRKENTEGNEAYLEWMRMDDLLTGFIKAAK